MAVPGTCTGARRVQHALVGWLFWPSVEIWNDWGWCRALAAVHCGSWLPNPPQLCIEAHTHRHIHRPLRLAGFHRWHSSQGWLYFDRAVGGWALSHGVSTCIDCMILFTLCYLSHHVQLPNTPYPIFTIVPVEQSASVTVNVLHVQWILILSATDKAHYKVIFPRKVFSTIQGKLYHWVGLHTGSRQVQVTDSLYCSACILSTVFCTLSADVYLTSFQCSGM